MLIIRILKHELAWRLWLFLIIFLQHILTVRFSCSRTNLMSYTEAPDLTVTSEFVAENKA